MNVYIVNYDKMEKNISYLEIMLNWKLVKFIHILKILCY